MKREQEMVREFHQKAGAWISPGPCNMPNNVVVLRQNLIQEEVNELWDALDSENLVETADAIGDLLYVVLGTAVSCGIDIAPIFDEIHRSNMSKFIDGHRREDGKWIKGPSYSPANLIPIIDSQTH